MSAHRLAHKALISIKDMRFGKSLLQRATELTLDNLCCERPCPAEVPLPPDRLKRSRAMSVFEILCSISSVRGASVRLHRGQATAVEPWLAVLTGTRIYF